MTKPSKVITNSFYLFLTQASTMLLGYIFWLVLAKLLSPTEVGVFSTLLNWSLFIIGFSVLGMSAAVPKLISEYSVSDEKKIGSTIKYSFKAVAGFNILILLFVLLAADFLPRPQALTANDLRLLGIIIFSLSLSYISMSYLYGLQMMKKFFAFNLIISVLKIIIPAAIILIFLNFKAAIAGYAAVITLVSLWALMYVPFSSGEVDKKRILSFAIPALISGPAGMLLNQGSIIVLTLTDTINAVGIFSIAFIVAAPIRAVSDIISQATLPFVSQKWTLGKIPEIAKVSRFYFKFVIAVALPLLIALYFFSGELLLLVSKQEYLVAASLIPILGVSFLFSGLGSNCTNMLYYIGKQYRYQNTVVIAGLLNVILSFVFVYRMGIFGAALAFLTSNILLFCLGSFWLKKEVKYLFPWRSLIKLIIPAALCAAVFYFVKPLYTGVVWMLVTFGAASIAYVSGFLIIRFLSKEEYEIARNIIDNFPPAVRPLGDFVLKTLKRV